MGFWNNLKKGLSDAGKSIAKGAKSVGNSIKAGIGKVAKKIDDWANKGNQVNQETSTRAEKAGEATKTTKSVIDYAQLETDYNLSMKPICKDLENEFINFYNQNFESLNIEEAPLPSDSKQTIRDSIKKGESKLKGTLIDYISSKVSKNNSEFCKIIKENKNSSREAKMSVFLRKTQSDAVKAFQKKAKAEVATQNKFIESFLNGELESIEKRANKSIMELEKIQNIDGEDLKCKQVELIKNGVIISQCEYIIEKCN